MDLQSLPPAPPSDQPRPLPHRLKLRRGPRPHPHRPPSGERLPPAPLRRRTHPVKARSSRRRNPAPPQSQYPHRLRLPAHERKCPQDLLPARPCPCPRHRLTLSSSRKGGAPEQIRGAPAPPWATELRLPPGSVVGAGERLILCPKEAVETASCITACKPRLRILAPESSYTSVYACPRPSE